MLIQSVTPQQYVSTVNQWPHLDRQAPTDSLLQTWAPLIKYFEFSILKKR